MLRACRSNARREDGRRVGRPQRTLLIEIVSAPPVLPPTHWEAWACEPLILVPDAAVNGYAGGVARGKLHTPKVAPSAFSP
jgi:hypothetical protein